MQTKNRVGKATALLALGGGYSAAMNNAVKSALAAGLFFAVPAGSENTDGNNSPASEPTACTVGGTTIDDARMPSSNYGPGGEFEVAVYFPSFPFPPLPLQPAYHTQPYTLYKAQF
jgi:hypothetical protein